MVIQQQHFDGLVQERRNSSALAMELHLSCTNPSTLYVFTNIETHDSGVTKSMTGEASRVHIFDLTQLKCVENHI